MSVWGCMGGWLGTFVRMCASNFMFTLGPSLVSKSTSSVFNRLSLVFKSTYLVSKLSHMSCFNNFLK